MSIFNKNQQNVPNKQHFPFQNSDNKANLVQTHPTNQKKKKKSSLSPSLGENVRRSVDHRRRDSVESGGLDGRSGGRRCRFDDRS